jgi:hypothetical protein
LVVTRPSNPANPRLRRAKRAPRTCASSRRNNCTLKKKGKNKRKNAWIFGLGGLFGLVVAGFFASSNEMIDLKSLEGMNLDSILDALPASFVSSAQQLQVSRPLRGAYGEGVLISVDQ